MKTGLVLTGGGARGIAHIGAIKALEKIGFKPDIIVGCSMGAIVGGIYACGSPIDFIEDYLINKFEFRKHTERWTFQFSRGPIVRFIQVEQALTAMIHDRGVDNGEKILNLIRELTQNKNFEQTEIPFACNAVDILSGKEIVLNSGNVAEAIRASMSLPGIFTPVTRGNMLLIDGGILNNNPIEIAKAMGARKILTIEVSPFVKWDFSDAKNGLAIFLRSLDVIGKKIESLKKQKPNLKIIAYDGTHTMDFDRKKQLIALGEEAVLKDRERIEKIFLRKIFGLRV